MNMMKAILTSATLLSMVSACGGSKGGSKTQPTAPVVEKPVNPGLTEVGPEGNYTGPCITYRNGEELASSDAYLSLLSSVVSNSNPDETTKILKAAENASITCK